MPTDDQTFAWQGFQIKHPEDWAPALVSGSRQEGYVRIASPDAASFQIRWKDIKRNADLLRSLDEYLSRLAKDARKLKTKFSSQVEQVDGQWRYKWSGAGNGKGAVFEAGGRVFFLEASSTSNKSIQTPFRDLHQSFRLAEGPTELWSLFSLSVRLRPGLLVDKQVFHSGRTRVEWRDRQGRIIAERWGFGEQILAKHTFEEWAKSSIGMPKAKVKEVAQGLELETSRLFLKTYGLAKFDADLNQLTTLKVVCRSAKGRPSWDWLI